MEKKMKIQQDERGYSLSRTHRCFRFQTLVAASLRLNATGQVTTSQAVCTLAKK